MGDDDGGFHRPGHQQVFQQRDAVDVEMVGGLVEQQQIGFFGQRQRQHPPLALAARGGGGGAVFIETEAM